MNRISNRISEALTKVKCPGCGTYVTPKMAPAEPAESSPEDSGARWSFIWRPPSGEICPQCNFPLARYARRLKWVRTFTAGVVLLTVSLLLFVLGMIGGFGDWSFWVPAGTALLGVAALIVGLVGIVLGSRHGPDVAPK